MKRSMAETCLTECDHTFAIVVVVQNPIKKTKQKKKGMCLAHSLLFIALIKMRGNKYDQRN